MSDLNRVAFRAVVHGRVQGVGFRWSTRRVARDLGVVGRVRNLADGTVEVIAEGDEAAGAKLRDWLRVGPPGARVDRLDVVAGAPTGAHDTFQID